MKRAVRYVKTASLKSASRYVYAMRPGWKSSIPSAILHQTLQLAQCTQVGDVLLASTKPRLSHQTAKQRSVIRYAIDIRCYSIVQWWFALHHSIWRLALCWWCKAGMQLFNHGNPFFEAPTTQFFFRYQYQLKFGILQLWNQPSWRHYAPCASALVTVLCDFMCYPASWLCFFSF